MKRLICATLVLSLLGGTAAAAAPNDHDSQGYGGGHSDQGYGNGYGSRDRADYHRGRGYNDNGAIFAGVGLLAFAAILASQDNHPYHHGWYNRDGGDYGNGDNRGYDHTYGERNGGYGYNGHR